jgi:hypothetical protein
VLDRTRIQNLSFPGSRFGECRWRETGEGKSESIFEMKCLVSGPGQDASSEAVSAIRKWVSIKEEGYESSK